MSNIIKVPKAKYHGELELRGYVLPCAVLPNGERLFSERGIATAFGIKGGGAYWQKKKTDSAVLPEYLSANYLTPFISNELREIFNSAVEYEAVNGTISNGIDVTVLPEICDVYIRAERAGVKNANLINAAAIAHKLLMGFAKVGIIALVDEATGYQYEREKKELQVVLKAMVSDDILDWQQAFHLNFYKEIFRLWGVPFTDKYIKRKPQFIGGLTNELVYKNLPKGVFVLDALKTKTPKTKGGNFKYRLHQSLTADVGREALKKVIYSIETLAAISETKEQFRKLVQNRYGQTSINFDEVGELDTPKPLPTLSTFNKDLTKALNYNPDKDKKK